MKKIFIQLFVIFYLSVSTGATMHFHYCMGQLIDWGFSQENSKECSNCGMNKSDANDCCKDRHQHFKTEDFQKASNAVFDFKSYELAIILPTYQNVTAFNCDLLVKNNRLIHAPPKISNTPVFIQLCNFRI